MPDARPPVSVALVHHPVYNRVREVVTTSITNVDIHDFARTCRTYGVDAFYVVTPLDAQREMCLRIAGHWTAGEGRTVDHPRARAFERIVVTDSIASAVADHEARFGARPRVVVTGAFLDRDVTTFPALRRCIHGEPRLPDDGRRTSDVGYLVLFGTGWGLVREVVDAADLRLEPIDAGTGFRHLPVRAAVAIVLDRLLGPGLY